MTPESRNNAREWLIIIGLAVSVGLSVFASAKDTPTRTEMESKDAAIEVRVDRQYTDMIRRLERIEAILLEQGGER
jgi:hypothetical protein